PASLDTVCLYCQFLSRSMTPQSVRNYLSGVKLLHVVTGFDFPFYETFELRLTLRGLDRIHRHLPSRAPPVIPDLLLSARSFDPAKHLCRGDIKITSFGLSVSFKWSKTNQTGSKVLAVPLLSNSDHLVCPVRAYL
ncbi:unnamed protein product, partial [Porites evermanni]